ncbi:MAG: hypothetical protein V4718_04375 [Pseudomonadota bacterium]
MTSRFYEVDTPRQAHIAAVNLYQHHAKPCTLKGGRGRLTWEEEDPESRAAMRGKFNGPILKDFAFQVWLLDAQTDQRVRYAPAVWKKHLKDLFCPLTQGPNGEWSKSTERLSDEQFSTFITECEAYGSCEWGVTFTERPLK